MGVPQVTAPTGAPPNQVAEAERLAAAIRVGEVAGVGLPAGFKLDLVGYSGSVPDTLSYIRYLDSQIASMALAGVLNLDDSPNGSRALGVAWVDLMMTALNALGTDIADTATQVSVSITDYNWGEDEPAPRVVAADVGSRPELTAEALKLLMDAQAIHPDPELEAWVRDRWSLPERTTPVATPPLGPPGNPPLSRLPAVVQEESPVPAGVPAGPGPGSAAT
jgi:hypothetical protein